MRSGPSLYKFLDISYFDFHNKSRKRGLYLKIRKRSLREAGQLAHGHTGIAEFRITFGAQIPRSLQVREMMRKIATTL